MPIEGSSSEIPVESRTASGWLQGCKVAIVFEGVESRYAEGDSVL